MFLSHTWDLRDAGRSVVRGGCGVGGIRPGDAVIDIEYFTARDAKPAEYCRQKVGEADVFVLIAGFRYGSPVRVSDLTSPRPNWNTRPLWRSACCSARTAPSRTTNARSRPSSGRWRRVFATPAGGPLNVRTDWTDWKKLLTAAGVRDGRLHKDRHTAATVLLLLGVPERAVMGVMGWSNTAMAARYQHVTATIQRDIANRVGGLIWRPQEDK